jgi:hypothetical protein
VTHAISRLAGPHSALFCHECFSDDSVECNPADEAIARLVGPLSPLFSHC